MTEISLRSSKEGYSLQLGGFEPTWPVGEVVEYQCLLVVRLEIPRGRIYNRNIIAFTRDGELLWQIQESPHGTEADKPFMRIFVDSENALVASNWNGIDYCINIENGELSVEAVRK